MTEGPLGGPRPFADAQLVMEISFRHRMAPNSADVIIEQHARDSISGKGRVDFKEFRDGKYKVALILPQHIDGDDLDRIIEGVQESPVVENQGNSINGYVIAVE